MASTDAMNGAKVFCASMWSFVCFATIALVLQASGASSRSSNIAVNTVSVADDGDSLLLTVTYSSGPDTKPLWVLPFLSPEGFVSLDFEVDNTFANGEGRTTARITHVEAAKQNPRISLRLLILRNQDCEVKIYLATFAALRSLSPASQDFGGINVTLLRGGTTQKPGQGLSFSEHGRFGMEIEVEIFSSELPKYSVSSVGLSHTRVERVDTLGGLLVRKNSYGYRADDPISVPDRGWRGSDTVKRVSFELKNVETAAGILKMTGLTLRQRKGVDALVTILEFRQNLYVVRREGQEAIPNNTVTIDSKRLHILTAFDVPMNLGVPQMNVVAVGNPSPIVTLRRRGDCDSTAAGNSADVEIVETRRQSKYEVNHFFRFKNASEALPGSYTVVARSGLMEVREIVSIGLLE